MGNVFPSLGRYYPEALRQVRDEERMNPQQRAESEENREHHKQIYRESHPESPARPPRASAESSSLTPATTGSREKPSVNIARHLHAPREKPPTAATINAWNPMMDKIGAESAHSKVQMSKSPLLTAVTDKLHQGIDDLGLHRHRLEEGALATAHHEGYETAAAVHANEIPAVGTAGPLPQLQTAPVDMRLAGNPDQYKYCWTSYNAYLRCYAKLGPDDPHCDWLRHTALDVCPSEQIDEWTEARRKGMWFGEPVPFNEAEWTLKLRSEERPGALPLSVDVHEPEATKDAESFTAAALTAIHK